MTELYSLKDAAKIFGQTESRLRYWIQSGFLWPSVRRAGQYFYTFDDLIQIRTAIELLDSGLSVQKVRKSLKALRDELPDGIGPRSGLRICSDGDKIVVLDDGVAYEAESRQLVMAFAVSSIQGQIADILPLRAEPGGGVVQAPLDCSETEREELPSAYQLFLHACTAEESGALDVAERYLRQCLSIEESMAAARTNLGNLLYKKGKLEEARKEYDAALLYEPDQPEARFNLGNLLDELGNREMAIAELRHVVTRNPEFADAHYNLGILLNEVGGTAQAKEHLEQYLSRDSESPWAERARSYLAS